LYEFPKNIALWQFLDKTNLVLTKICETDLLHINLQNYMRRDVYQAIADPTRRAILVLLATHAMTPNALAAHFDSTRQAVSKHLRILSECELIKSKQEGREITYTIEAAKMKEIDKWLEQFRKLWEKRFSQLDEVLEKMKKK